MALLDRGFRYIACLSHMRVYLRQAKFHWKGDQLVFLRAVAGFYQEYGKVLRLIQEDMARGLLTPDSMTEGV